MSLERLQRNRDREPERSINIDGISMCIQLCGIQLNEYHHLLVQYNNIDVERTPTEIQFQIECKKEQA